MGHLLFNVDSIYGFNMPYLFLWLQTHVYFLTTILSHRIGHFVNFYKLSLGDRIRPVFHSWNWLVWCTRYTRFLRLWNWWYFKLAVIVVFYICLGLIENEFVDWVVWYSRARFDSSPPSSAYTRQWIGSILVEIMACRLFGAKPLSKPMLGYCQLDP